MRANGKNVWWRKSFEFATLELHHVTDITVVANVVASASTPSAWMPTAVGRERRPALKFTLRRDRAGAETAVLSLSKSGEGPSPSAFWFFLLFLVLLVCGVLVLL